MRKNKLMKISFFLGMCGVLLCSLTPQLQAVHIVKSGDKTVQVTYAPNLLFTPLMGLSAGIWPDKGETITQVDEATIEWSGNYFNAEKFDTQRFWWNLQIIVNDTANNIVRTFFPAPWPFPPTCQVIANWTQLPITEIFTIRVKGRFETLNIEAAFNQTAEIRVEILPRPQAAPAPSVPGGMAGFSWQAPGNLSWDQHPKGPVPVASGVPQAGWGAVSAGTGPVLIYQTGQTIRYKMMEAFSGKEMADGEVGPGKLIKVSFDPAQFGARATIAAQVGSNRVYYVFKIDQWGKAGTTKMVGSPLQTSLPHWTVQWRSLIFLFEFEQSSGRLSCKDNYSGWNTQVDSGVDGLIVPAATGGGPVVVYGNHNNVRAVLLKWDTGAKISEVALGSGTLLQVTYTKRGAYGARGVADIKSSGQVRKVAFCVDLWGDVGCNRVEETKPWPPTAPVPPDPPPGFPGGGESGGGGADAPDSDGDGFSDDYEKAAGTNPSDPNSHPNIDTSIVLLIDKSGSMNDNNKMEDAKKAAIDALTKINKTTEIGVIAYSGDCGETFPIVADFSQDIGYLTQQIQTIQAGGGTPMSPALFQARDFLVKKAHGKGGLIILLCDGQNDCAPNEADAAQQIFQKQFTAQITSLPVGFGLPGWQTYGVGFSPLTSPFPLRRGVQNQPQAGAGQGGPDSVPPGATSVDVIPDDPEQADRTRGGLDVVPPGVQPPQDIRSVAFTAPEGDLGVQTDLPPASQQAPNQQMPIHISTVGLGLQNDPQAQEALARVATAGGGQFYSAQNLNQLTTAFSQAISQQPGGVGGGGGGGGVTARTPGGLPGWLIIIVVLGLGILGLVIAIAVVRRRSGAPAPAGTVYVNLDVYYQDGTSARFPVQSRSVSIGGVSGNTIVINDPMVSSRHAELIITDQGYFLRDLGSTNGTFVNGKPIAETSLYLNDEIRMGSTKIVFRG